jgi:integrase
MSNQILKAMKGLKTFTIEDIEQITNYETAEILEVIEQLNLTEKNGTYSFEKPVQKKPTRKTNAIGKTILFKSYAQRFMKSLKCKETTKRGYEIYLRLHILPVLGNMRITDIKSNNIEVFKKDKLREGQSNKSVNNFIVFLFSIFEQAVNHDLIAKNPCRNIEKLEVESKRKELIEDEINNLLSKAKEKSFWFYVLLLIAIETRLSRGQIVDLKWDNIDFKNENIQGIRISKRLKDELLKWQKICPVNSLNLIFPGVQGGKMCANSMVKWKFKPVCKQAGLEGLRFIDLRN